MNAFAFGELLSLTSDAVSHGDRQRTYPAGTRFRFVKMVEDLPDETAVNTEYHYGDRLRPVPRGRVGIPPLAMVVSVSYDRSRLLFDPAVLERVPTPQESRHER